MASNTFFMVPQITADEKYFDVSLDEVLRAVLTPMNGLKLLWTSCTTPHGWWFQLIPAKRTQSSVCRQDGYQRWPLSLRCLAAHTTYDNLAQRSPALESMQ